MRAVWSFWSKPFRAHHRWAWPSERHHWLAWVLSVETARRHYARTALVTDDEGAQLLVDRLGLPFGDVSTELNALAQHDPEWWALGKLYAYRAQNEPFVHLDNDVFLWQPLPDRVVEADVFAQNPEDLTLEASYYHPEDFEAVLDRVSDGWLPKEWVWFRSARHAQHAACCGILGGQRVDFIRYYTVQAIKLIEHPGNQPAWALLADKVGNNILFEQYLLAACVEYHRGRSHSPYHGLELGYLFGSNGEAFDPARAAQFGFTHLIAGAKRNPEIAARLARRVQRDYPAYYERCLKVDAPRS